MLTQKCRTVVPILLLVCASFPLVGRPASIPGTEVDQRLGPLLGEEGDFSFQPPVSKDAWQERASRVRSILQVTLGLWPPPTRTPLNPVVHGRREMDGYSIENVILESAPGFFLTGNLYRPHPFDPNQRHAAVLSPHGHFPGGRFIDEGTRTVRQKIADDAERFENGGRSFMQSRCVQLARMGCVVFHYDMIGYGDCEQIPLEVAHRFSRLRRTFTTPPQNGFHSARAEQHLFNPMGLHVWNSQRALDFLANLPAIDPNRIAVTGGSGGGTQTFMLCAVDDRPLVSVPVVILSTTRQGGCTCENISGLRWGSYNLEFAALHAPKPQLLISADDATRTMNRQGFPDLRTHYRLLGHESAVGHEALLHFPHNYNHVSRTKMYHWLNHHLHLGLEEPILERDYDRQTGDELTVWDAAHPRPAPDPQFVDRLLDWFAEDAQKQLADLIPHDRPSLHRYREIVGEAWSVLLRAPTADARPEWHALKVTQREGYLESRGVLRYQTFNGLQGRLPVTRLKPHPPINEAKSALVWLDSLGMPCLYQENGELQPEVRRALASGHEVISANLFLQGDSQEQKDAPQRQRHLPGEEAFAGWTYCYNLPLFAQRVYDAMTLMAWLEHPESRENGFVVLGSGKAGPVTGAAIALFRSPSLLRVSIETSGFRFEKIGHVYDVDFLPGATKYGDLPGLLALAAPTPLQVSGETADSLRLVQAAYRAEGKSNQLRLSTTDRATTIDWLLRLE